MNVHNMMDEGSGGLGKKKEEEEEEKGEWIGPRWVWREEKVSIRTKEPHYLKPIHQTEIVSHEERIETWRERGGDSDEQKNVKKLREFSCWEFVAE